MSDSDANAFPNTDLMAFDGASAAATGPAVALQKGGSAGAMLRRAREAAGVSTTEMSTLLKVTEKKLAALEEDRYTELPDLAFARALAKSICKHLKVSAEPVLDALPRLNVFEGVEHSDVALNMPYRDRSLSAGYASGRGDMAWMRRKSVWGTAAVLLLIAGMFAVSPDVISRFTSAPAPVVKSLSDGTTVSGVSVATVSSGTPARPAEPAVAPPGGSTVADQVVSGQLPVPAGAATAPVEVTAAPPAVATAPPASEPGAVAGQSVHLQASQEVWVQVMSGKKRLFERTLQPGEAVDVPGEAPLRIVAGRAEAVTVSYNGQPLTSTAKGTVGRYRVEP